MIIHSIFIKSISGPYSVSSICEIKNIELITHIVVRKGTILFRNTEKTMVYYTEQPAIAWSMNKRVCSNIEEPRAM